MNKSNIIRVIEIVVTLLCISCGPKDAYPICRDLEIASLENFDSMQSKLDNKLFSFYFWHSKEDYKADEELDYDTYENGSYILRCKNNELTKTYVSFDKLAFNLEQEILFLKTLKVEGTHLDDSPFAGPELYTFAFNYKKEKINFHLINRGITLHVEVDKFLDKLLKNMRKQKWRKYNGSEIPVARQNKK